ncbi:hypothetical protein J2Z21_004732 [Streptomyces griseochromogenes]|uniref:Chaplin domain-containing protein n=1 Tax=Streptomyces griseochromogenes TaxID=68214 RepID=A0A1B1AT88_9ACTN|nr:hypothetical protein [Streptomyces griseochromogenes]ANP49765.1 hypothetical protein AVL59_09215 [Streptomyces griseochromogenes]MBP2051755.1 hypothetical protein [Streptomyces griseochromogenes]
MIKSSRIAAVTLLTVGGLALSASSASAVAQHVDSLPAGGTHLPLPPTVSQPDGSPTGAILYSVADPIGFGPLNVGIPALGVL